MDIKSSLSQEWHIPRPSLSGSSVTSLSDSRSRGGSASSQGSSSNHSTQSVSSGSLLLTAAHLARKQNRTIEEESPHFDTKLHTSELIPPIVALTAPAETKIHPNEAKLEAIVPIPEESHSDPYWSGVKRGSATAKGAMSNASSTHFTVVNGFTRHKTNKEPKTCCCNHSHQITVLVISMTILFSACILAAICFVEMRMRKETGIYRYS